MAKLIKLTQEVIDEVRREFDAYIKDKISNGRISFQKTVNTVQRKATVYFTESAYRKFQALVNGFDNEVAWHGIAHRGLDESKDEYYITDILVYPQEVTGATVTTDQNRYQTWLMNHDDETFNSIRMQGHSHVNMGVTPSGVDENLYDSILAQLDNTMFYIFMIWNKKNDKTCRIYDLAKNILFDTADCEIKMITQLPDDVSIDGVTEEERAVMIEALQKLRCDKMCKQFVEDAKKLVTTKTYTTTHYRFGAPSSHESDAGYSYYCSGNYGTSISNVPVKTTSERNANCDAKKRRKGKRRRESDAATRLLQNYYLDDDDVL